MIPEPGNLLCKLLNTPAAGFNSLYWAHHGAQMTAYTALSLESKPAIF